mmetsp:Transcript_21501/g.48851  ORF Transcript_21501/g.48851 Transcript_21501/m.48851 type:complete len:235 (+) Transcript_21501:3803-4507(+)
MSQNLDDEGDVHARDDAQVFLDLALVAALVSVAPEQFVQDGRPPTSDGGVPVSHGVQTDVRGHLRQPVRRWPGDGHVAGAVGKDAGVEGGQSEALDLLEGFGEELARASGGDVVGGPVSHPVGHDGVVDLDEFGEADQHGNGVEAELADLVGALEAHVGFLVLPLLPVGDDEAREVDEDEPVDVSLIEDAEHIAEKFDDGVVDIFGNFLVDFAIEIPGVDARVRHHRNQFFQGG